MHPDLLVALSAGGGRGFTMLCTCADDGLLIALSAVCGSTGLVVAAGSSPPLGTGWHALRCDPAVALPLRSHVVDATVVDAEGSFADIAAELRRVLAPGGELRVLARTVDAAVEDALHSAAIRPLRWEQFPDELGAVLIARGP